MAGLTGDGRIRVWDTEAGTELGVIEQVDQATGEPDPGAFWDAALTPDGSQVIAGGADGQVVSGSPVGRQDAAEASRRRTTASSSSSCPPTAPRRSSP